MKTLAHTCLLLALQAAHAADPYETYVRTSRDFRAVKQDREWALPAWPSWTDMPWTHQWSIGYDDDAGRWSRAHGYHGAFIDHGSTAAGGSKTGRLDWINQHGLRFYVDHLAGKGALHLFDGGKEKPRVAGAEEAKKRDTFIQHVAAAGITPRVALAGAGEGEHGHEITHWRLSTGRSAIFLCLNPETRGTSLGGGNSVGLKKATVPVTLRFARPVHDAGDERTGRALDDGTEFRLHWNQNEALVLSREGLYRVSQNWFTVSLARRANGN